MKESWEELLEDDHTDDKIDETLSKEAQEKLLVRKSELRDNLTSALELFGEQVPDTLKQSKAVSKPHTTRLRTKEDANNLAKTLTESIQSHKSSVHYVTLVDNLIQKLAETLQVSELKKLVGEIQTLCNAKLQEEQEKKQRNKPMLKFGGSTKTAFDLDYTNYEDEDEEYSE